ncbi:hypothetical protein HZH68_000913 [Vespula germanica]|uniref:Uncharacterized protein n=1 Tax=Vespula germanica TaxID=30212 RepID=A0A834U6G2_VESGE|nr:hypothetical protein HZH68_000913 [Vespula germanica]
MIEQIASKGHQICTSEHEDEKRVNDKEKERVAYANGRGKRDEGKKDGIAWERKSNDERTSRNKTVISRHFTHERERLADSTFDILHTYVPTPWYLCARDVKEMKGKGIIVGMLQILEESCAKTNLKVTDSLGSLTELSFSVYPKQELREERGIAT